jgi:RNA polymerase sigma-70 factor (ECF subfamily)
VDDPNPNSDIHEGGEFSSDLELVLRAQARDKTAFGELYNPHSHRLCIFLTRMVGDNDDGCDLTQETFLRAWRSLRDLEKPTSFLSWLYSIARHLVIDYERKNRNRRNRDVSYDRTPECLDGMNTDGPEEVVETAEYANSLLLQVRPEYRACLILYYVQDLEVHEVAALLGLATGTVRVYLSKGLSELRRLWHEH